MKKSTIKRLENFFQKLFNLGIVIAVVALPIGVIFTLFYMVQQYLLYTHSQVIENIGISTMVIGLLAIAVVMISNSFLKDIKIIKATKIRRR